MKNRGKYGLLAILCAVLAFVIWAQVRSWPQSPMRARYLRIEERIKDGEIGFTLERDDKFLFLNIVNGYGNTVFAREADLKISSIQVQSPDKKFLSMRREGNGPYVLKGPERYTRLAYDRHPGGDICGWQLTPFQPASLEYEKESDLLSVRASVDLFLGDVGKDRTLRIDFSIPVGEIPFVQSSKTTEQPH